VIDGIIRKACAKKSSFKHTQDPLPWASNPQDWYCSSKPSLKIRCRLSSKSLYRSIPCFCRYTNKHSDFPSESLEAVEGRRDELKQYFNSHSLIAPVLPILGTLDIKRPDKPKSKKKAPDAPRPVYPKKELTGFGKLFSK